MLNLSKRYCNIRAKNLDELLESINRNIANTYLMRLSAIDADDLTGEDEFYCGMLIGILQDMKEDLQEIIQRGNTDV